MAVLGERFKNAWNAFMGRDPTIYTAGYYGNGNRPDRSYLSRANARSIVGSIYNQIAVDVSSVNIRHVRLDDDGRFLEEMNSTLNRALSLDANTDQTGRSLIRDATISMLDEGVIAIVPVEAIGNPSYTESYKIIKLRVGKIVEWFPQHIRVEIYNEFAGRREQITVEKRICAIVENPFYTIMNEPNSTAQRLIRVLNQLDRTNDRNSAGKLDMIIQFPYQLKSDARKRHAEQRRKDLEDQLTGSQYGVGYTDATEKIVQLNRPIENNLWAQARDLQEDLYNELGLSRSVFDGTADEKATLNYQNRTLEPILSAITEEMERKWISLTGQTQHQAIRFFKDPFKLVPVSEIAEIADKFTRNEIASSNEIRSVIGMKPSDDPKADMLINSNLNQSNQENSRIYDNEKDEENSK